MPSSSSGQNHLRVQGDHALTCWISCEVLHRVVKGKCMWDCNHSVISHPQLFPHHYICILLCDDHLIPWDDMSNFQAFCIDDGYWKAN